MCLCLSSDKSRITIKRDLKDFHTSNWSIDDSVVETQDRGKWVENMAGTKGAKEGHRRIRGRNRKRESRRGTVHGLIRVAINNLGPDIWTWRPSQCLSVFSARCAFLLLLLFLVFLLSRSSFLFHLSILLCVSYTITHTHTRLCIIPAIYVPAGSESDISKTGFSLAARKRNEPTDRLGTWYDVNTQLLIAHSDTEHQSPPLRNISVTLLTLEHKLCWRCGDRSII